MIVAGSPVLETADITTGVGGVSSRSPVRPFPDNYTKLCHIYNYDRLTIRSSLSIDPSLFLFSTTRIDGLNEVHYNYM